MAVPVSNRDLVAITEINVQTLSDGLQEHDIGPQVHVEEERVLLDRFKGARRRRWERGRNEERIVLLGMGVITLDTNASGILPVVMNAETRVGAGGTSLLAASDVIEGDGLATRNLG